jgi:hypothetical protein
MSNLIMILKASISTSSNVSGISSAMSSDLIADLIWHQHNFRSLLSIGFGSVIKVMLLLCERNI